MPEIYKSYGKLLLSGEYAVLNGAKALALPIKLQQSLKIETVVNNVYLNWFAKDTNKFDFQTKINLRNLEVVESNNVIISDKLALILQEISKLNPDFNKIQTGYNCYSEIEWPIEYGLGSSSTLINNLSKWANVNPYKLNKKIFNGSGYDVACASSKKPIFYQLSGDENLIKEAAFNPHYHKNIAFIYLGKKQNSKLEIEKYKLNRKQFSNSLLTEISQISVELAEQKELPGFQKLIVQHESIISKLIQKEPVKKIYFTDFEGAIKSLGAWGGDFILASSENGFDYIQNYFNKKGLNIILTYKDIIR